LIAVAAVLVPASATVAQRRMEFLDRGVIAVRQEDGRVFVGWRLLGTDPDAIAFNVYRRGVRGEPVKLNDAPIADVTYFVDGTADAAAANTWFVKSVVLPSAGRDSGPSLATASPQRPGPDSGPSPNPSPERGGGQTARAERGESGFAAKTPTMPYLSIPLQTPEGYRPNDASVGDLDGDGQYEIVLHLGGRGRDNSQAGQTDPPILQAYQLDGTLMWQINLGRNIREGAHYTQFMVYDLDGDGRAEIACKTADGTVDGTGEIIGDAAADYRNERGYILEGPEFLTIFDGRTGAALQTVDYIPPRGRVADWGDDYGNRVDRFLACVAYLDGERPSLVMCRGYYTRAVLAAWNWRDGKLSHVWTFDSDDGAPGNRAFRGQGNHNISVGDVDGDGRDEIIYGSAVIDDDGSGQYATGFGHGDAMHFTDIDPDRVGLEVFKANGDRQNAAGIQLRDARTGEQLFGRASTGREGVGRACALDIDPRHRGLEMWGKGAGVEGLWNVKSEKISDVAPRTCNMGVWWDGDLLRELLDGVRVTKWDYENSRERALFDGGRYEVVSNNGTKSNPCLCADILGDWREEIIAATGDGRELRIFTTTIPTETRMPTLMHDPTYRLGVTWQNVAYNQPAHPGFYLGEGMNKPPRPRIRTEKR
jgi:rhamnogalacturonan endolyase